MCPGCARRQGEPIGEVIVEVKRREERARADRRTARRIFADRLREGDFRARARRLDPLDSPATAERRHAPPENKPRRQRAGILGAQHHCGPVGPAHGAVEHLALDRLTTEHPREHPQRIINGLLDLEERCCPLKLIAPQRRGARILEEADPARIAHRPLEPLEVQPIGDPVRLDAPRKMRRAWDVPFTPDDLEQQRPYRRREPTVELAECLERLLDGGPLSPALARLLERRVAPCRRLGILGLRLRPGGKALGRDRGIESAPAPRRSNAPPSASRKVKVRVMQRRICVSRAGRMSASPASWSAESPHGAGDIAA